MTRLTESERTRIRDQERGPVAADLKIIAGEKSLVGQKTFALTADLSEAHRRVPTAERDWYLLVGHRSTVASASYCWSRVAWVVGRAVLGRERRNLIFPAWWSGAGIIHAQSPSFCRQLPFFHQA